MTGTLCVCLCARVCGAVLSPLVLSCPPHRRRSARSPAVNAQLVEYGAKPHCYSATLLHCYTATVLHCYTPALLHYYTNTLHRMTRSTPVCFELICACIIKNVLFQRVARSAKASEYSKTPAAPAGRRILHYTTPHLNLSARASPSLPRRQDRLADYTTATHYL